MDKENQIKLPDAFGDLVSSKAYSELTGIDQESLRKQASIHDAILKIGEADYICLSTLLMGQLNKLKMSDGTASEAFDPSEKINTVNSIGTHHCMVYQLSALSAIKESKLKELFGQMHKEKDPSKRINLAHEYNRIYSELDKAMTTTEITKKHLKEVGDREKKRIEPAIKDIKSKSLSKKKPLSKFTAPSEKDLDIAGEVKWIPIGRVYIDTRTILLCDPCRFFENVDFMRESIAMGNEQLFRQVGDNIGVLSRTSGGAGECEVEALVFEDKGSILDILEIRIRFVDLESIDDV